MPGRVGPSAAPPLPPPALSRLNASAPNYDVPAPNPEPSFLAEVFGVRLAGILLAAALAGLVDGGVRAFGIDPSLFLLQAEHLGFSEALSLNLPGSDELVGVLGCVCKAVFHYVLLGFAFGLVPALLMSGARRATRRMWRGRPRVFRGSLGWALGVWLAAAVYWWTRPVLFPGLPATDPKRLASAAGLLILGLVAGLLLARILRPRLLGLWGVLAVLLFGLGAASMATQWTVQGSRGAINDRNRELPNVVLVIVDALRQDTIAAYGHQEVHTPNIDRVAAEGVLFENAFAPTPFTWPSFGSILSGKVPRRHGLMRMEPGVTFPVNATLPLLLEMGKREDGTQLVESDWIQGAFMTGTLSHGSGLLDGFDVYLEALVGHDLVDVHSRWSKFRSGLLPWLVRNKLQQKGDQHLVTTTAEKWLTQHADRRFLSMVHLYSTHTPYDPADEFRERHLDPAYEGPFDSFVAAHREAIEDGTYEPTPADKERIERLYLAGVEEADAMIGRLLERLGSLGVLDNTIFIVTSDHGESLGEHGLWEHNWMYQDNLRVPLVMRFPGGLPQGKRVDALVDSIDIVPTVLDLVGLAAPVAAEDAEDLVVDREGNLNTESPLLWDAIDGASLVPLASGEVDALRRYSFSENGLFLSVQDARWKLIVRRNLVHLTAYSDLVQELASGVADVERPRLFDVESDPLELLNRFDPGDEGAMAEAKRLFDALVRQGERLPIRVDQVRKGGRDERAEQLFKSLGYAGGVGADANDLKREREAAASEGEDGADD